MPLFLLNPWGLLALAGLPVVIAIHLLRRQSREVTTSTLFLLEKIPTSKEGGRRLQNLRQSLPFWLQIATVCVVALLLAQPRWLDPASHAQVAIVLDSSASMGAFRDQALGTLDKLMTAQSRQAATMEWTVLSSDGSRLAAGSDREEILKKISSTWQPVLHRHDPRDALRIASTAGDASSGQVFYLTDHAQEGASQEINWIACGEPKDNAAFVGSSVQEGKWSAIMRNFSPYDRTVRWRIKGNESPWQDHPIRAGGLATVEGAFPGESDRIVLELEPDALAIDNTLPIIRPQPKLLNLALSQNDEDSLALRISRLATPSTRDPALPADITIASYDPLSPGLPTGNAIAFVQDPSSAQKPLTASLVTENHLLMTDLNWQGLRVYNTLGVPFRDTDIPLLWQGTRPLIFLRQTPDSRQLIFNFDLQSSNASQIPAFPILIHRFLEDIRQTKPAFEARNLDTAQRITIAGHGKTITPTSPDFFTIPDSSGNPLLSATAQFFDPAESDLRQANSTPLPSLQTSQTENLLQPGAGIDLVLAFLLASLLMANWRYTAYDII